MGPPAPSPVDQVQLSPHHLTWTHARDGTPGRAALDEILFILDPSASRTGTGSYLICCLKEDADNAARPFELRLLATAALPAPILQQEEEDDQRVRIIRRVPSHLDTAHAALDVVISTKSGLERGVYFWEQVLQPLLQALCPATPPEYRVVVTQDANSITQYARGLASAGSSSSKTILLVSGDGGVVDLLNGRATASASAADGDDDDDGGGGGGGGGGDGPPQHTKPLIALLPLGTGNALFHSLHKHGRPPIPASPQHQEPTSSIAAAVRTLFLGVPADLPVFQAAFSPGSLLASPLTSSPSSSSSSAAAAASDAVVAGTASFSTPVTAPLLGAIVASYAFHASIVYESDTPEWRVHGSKRFGLVAQQLLREAHPYRATVEVVTAPPPPPPSTSPTPTSTSTSAAAGAAAAAAESVADLAQQQDHGYVLVAMVSNLEKNFTISPDTRPLDGTLHLVQFGPVGQQKTMEAMMKAYDGGKHVHLRWDDIGQRVRYQEVREVKVTTDEDDARWRKFCVDGTIVEVPKGGSMTVSKVDEALFRVLVDKSVVSSHG